MPGGKTSLVMGVVEAGFGEDGGEGSAGAGSQLAPQGCGRALGANAASPCVAPISTHAGAGEVGNRRGFGRAGSSGETEARFTQEHREGAGPNWYPAAST